MMSEIKLKQAPIITHELMKIGESVSKRLQDLNLEKQVATIDTVKSLKTLRAELNKEFGNYESQRKSIKKAVNDPFVEFENLYKTEISEKYKGAKETLDSKISSVEIKIKEEKKKNIESYFSELCASEDIDFLIFENAGLKIDLSTTEKKYKEQCNTFVEKIKSDLSLIDNQEYKVEISAEYKKSLNISEAINNVVTRKKNEEEERLRLEKVKHLSRSKKLQEIGLKPDAETGTYAYNDSIYVVWDSVKDIEETEFTKIIVSKDVDIKDFIASTIKEEVKEPTKETPRNFTDVTESKTLNEPLKEVLKAPVVEEKQDIVNAKFQVNGTLKQLKALGQYMKDNGITYKNI